jgi:hypothetical protein
MGTAVSLVILALQAGMPCANWNLVSTSRAYCSWLSSSISCLWATVGAFFFGSLIGGSLGPRMMKEFPIEKSALLHRLVGVLAGTFPFITFGLGWFGQGCSELLKVGLW